MDSKRFSTHNLLYSCETFYDDDDDDDDDRGERNGST